MADGSRLETWTIRGPVDVGCAACGAIGAELRCEVLVELACPAIRMVEGNRPVEFECLSCGAIVRYGDTVRAEVSR